MLHVFRGIRTVFWCLQLRYLNPVWIFKELWWLRVILLRQISRCQGEGEARWVETEKETKLRACGLVSGAFYHHHSGLFQTYKVTVFLLVVDGALCWLLCAVLQSLWGLCRGPQSSCRLPVTLFTICSSPMMPKTVREPDATCRNIHAGFLNLTPPTIKDSHIQPWFVLWLTKAFSPGYDLHLEPGAWAGWGCWPEPAAPWGEQHLCLAAPPSSLWMETVYLF